MEREVFIDNLLVRTHFIIVLIRWTGLAPWGFESSFSGSHMSTFLVTVRTLRSGEGCYLLQYALQFSVQDSIHLQGAALQGGGRL